MAIVEDRYLNLAGAPWSPLKPDARLTLVNYFAAAATSATIFGASFANPSVENNALLYIFEGVTAAALTLYLAGGRRKIEARQLSDVHHQLVIDTQPNKNTPPTSSDILTRIHKMKHRYQYEFSPSGIGAACYGSFMAAAGTNTLFTDTNDVALSGAAFFMPFFVIHGSDILSRYHQLHKISNLEWVISEHGDAVKNFQHEDTKNHIAAHGAALVPIKFN